MKINLPKILNVFFHALIVGTLLLCLFMMTKYFFFKDNKPLELGNLSDWVSSLSTLGTFIVAWMAFKSAPNWLSQKFDEESLKIGLEINHMIKFDHVNALKKMNIYLQKDIDRNIDNIKYYNKFITTEGKQEISKSYEELKKFTAYVICNESIQVMNKIETAITKLNMMEWHLRPEKKAILDSVRLEIDKIKRLKKNIDDHISHISNKSNNGFYNYDLQKEEIKKLKFIFEDVKSKKNEIFSSTYVITECINEYGSTKSFRSYFHRIIE